MKSRDTFVDYARLALALSVCLFHVSQTYHRFWPQGYYPVWAVPAFLAVSGYYVLRSYEHSKSWGDFLVRRILRIVPALLISLSLVCIVGGVSGLGATLMYYIRAGMDPHPGRVINYPMWSLIVEEVAYALLAILFMLRAYKAIWPIWILFGFGLIVSHLVDVGGNDLTGTFRVANLVCVFFMGSLVYLHRDKGLPLWAGVPIIAFGLYLPIARIHTLPVISPTALSGMLVGFGILTMRKVKSPRIPDLSYSCYIYHLPLFVFLAAGPSVYFPCLGICCAASWFLIEKPSMKLKELLQARHKLRGIITAVPKVQRLPARPGLV